ncbi:single-stranded-DNA-specific exonuclease RecJ [Aureimonas populi]|uniref:Single-stranded-DNA-specific exonuclease RecJ n=1 Tax=Aureimonas populi TaxID=1701758 RepID=A0ABW5CM82_9HYPH|nr:single-stranded-DNA-specific exonuclease RecJ [Aureimonas populi]
MNDSARTFLGVEASLLGRRWTHALTPRTEALAVEIAQRQGLPDLVARVLAARGVAAPEAARFLDPTIRDLMPDPSSLTDMDAAALRLADAIERRERIAIFGDYDVDGAASVALLFRYLRHFGLEAAIRIPDRLTEGYGPNPTAMRELAAGGAQLIVTVDCGTTSVEALTEAARARAQVIVLDHHQTGTALPPALAIVNPNRQDDLSGQGHLCAAGVVYLTLVAVSRELRRRGHAAARLPNLLDDLDLAALATVCDVVPLTGFNRALVVKGLQVLRGRRNIGLKALCNVARLAGPASVYHLGFLLGPRINAGGRIGAAHLGSRLLTTGDEGEAEALAQELHLLNEERQGIERRMLDEAEAEVAAEIGAGEGPAILIASRQDWHPGIVGLVASRLKERFGRPAFAIAFDASGRGSGSGRSIPGFDVGSLIRRAVEDGLLVKGGGHAMAAGLTIERSRLSDFRAFLEAAAGNRIHDLRAQDTLRIDGAVSASGLTLELAGTLERAGPYGQGHSQPVLALPRHRVISGAPVGASGHLRVTLKAADGASLSAIAFRAMGTPLEPRLLDSGGRPVHVAGCVSLDHFQGRERVSFRISDIADAYD